MIILSLVVNIAVLVPVLWVLARGLPAADVAWGPDSAARRILGTLYLAILLASLALLGAHLSGMPAARGAIQTLLALQVVYKLASVGAVGLGNPVVRANLLIALLHGATLAIG